MEALHLNKILIHHGILSKQRQENDLLRIQTGEIKMTWYIYPQWHKAERICK